MTLTRPGEQGELRHRSYNDPGGNKALTWREKGKAWPGVAESCLTRHTHEEDDPLEANMFGEIMEERLCFETTEEDYNYVMIINTV